MKLKQNWRFEVIKWLEKNVSERRLQHIFGVEETCVELARTHNCSMDKAAQAGILHDLAKFFPKKKLLKIAESHSLKVDSICLQHPHLIHADIGAILAKEKFDITSNQILNAIANHTLGKPEMDTLSCIVYVADAIEPGRGDTDELNKLRRTAQKNLLEAVWQVSDYSLQYLIQNRKVIHPRTIATRNWALEESKGKQT